jgi:hypothetical protein
VLRGYRAFTSRFLLLFLGCIAIVLAAVGTASARYVTSCRPDGNGMACKTISIPQDLRRLVMIDPFEDP